MRLQPIASVADETTDSGQVYSWDWTNGIQPVTETEGYKVGAYESGSEHHLMLAN